MQVDVREQRACLLVRNALALGQLGDDLLDAATEHPGEAAHGPLGDGHVREAVHVQVQQALGAVGNSAVQGADQRERRHVYADGHQTGAANGREQTFDHVALGRHEHHPLSWTRRGLDDAEGLKVEHGVGERHRHLVRRLEPDSCGELLGVA